jgi:UDP-4-amino-4,6-dideoxy-N-acetyl-beta-L-altrosamine transaminase
MQRNIPYARQQIDEDDISAVVEVLKSDYITTGPKIAEFEEALKDVSGSIYVAAVNSGTAALHAACFAAGIRPGDEVIVPAITFAASANCVLYMGGTPVFCDIDPHTWNIDPDKVESLITKKTKAIIPVHFMGQPCDMDKIRSIASRHGLVVIEDASHALGACWRGKPVGSMSDLTVFSFHPVKHITTGEGGAVATSDSRFYRLISSFRTHGITRDPEQFEYGNPCGVNSQSAIISEGATDNYSAPAAPWYYEQQLLGYNYRLTDIQAALGLSQLKKLPAFLRRRKEIAQMYDIAFEDLCRTGLLTLPKQLDGAESAWHLYVVKIGGYGVNTISAPSPENLTPSVRDRVFDSLKSMGIGVNLHYIPVYLHPYYRKLGFKAGLCPIAEQLYSAVITLPLYPSMTDSDVQYVVKSLKSIIL